MATDWERVEKNVYRRRGRQGLWIVFWSGGRSRREAVKSEKITDARRLLQRRQTEAEDGTLPSARMRRTRFEELAEDFITDYQANGRKSLKRARLSIKHLSEFFGGKRVAAITPAAISKYVTHRLAQEPRPANGKINRELAALHRTLSLAMRNGKIRAVPVFPEYLKEGAPREGFVDEETFDLLRRALRPDLRPLLITLYETGMRVGEALGLAWEGAEAEGASGHVSLRERAIRLKAAATKSGHGRTIPMTSTLYEALRATKDERDI